MYNAHRHVQAAFILARKPNRSQNWTALQLLTLLVHKFMIKLRYAQVGQTHLSNAKITIQIPLKTFSCRASEQTVNILKKMLIFSGDVDNKIDHRVTDVYMYYIQARITAKF